ncbi:uncharacterized protein EHS24_006682 [Apiotrichum porosum]|uniref:Glycoside hydrolase family 5 domain-containing protein n=1 Tax=Apiotrichum porosum TaxID=105984 RepID=A0A427Y1Y2_9TREE|nr:uncharacterized protein EHS24_006682 [Apiotrichum porosum]RSH85089.1 hypothetical protein EHS24_006682 [Apiotrichum porosum]
MVYINGNTNGNGGDHHYLQVEVLMENFMNGFAGQENQARAAMKAVMGDDKYTFFFDKFLEYYFTEADAKFLASMGFNCIRIAINYRHFEDDMNPRVLKTSGFKHLDRVVDLCAANGIYTVIDLHSLPGGQNMDWHSDNNTNQALFWLWEILADHFRDNTWVAGYNPMNEPADVEHERLQAFYVRIEAAIRAVDPHHILFLDGNSFGYDFSHFKKPLPNCVYSCHDYSVYGFPAAPELYSGTQQQVEYHERTFRRKADFMLETKTPIWNSEFGPTYSTPKDGDNWETVNDARYQVLKLQLDINRRHNASYNIGVMGIVYPAAESPLLKLLAPFLAKKKASSADGWGFDETPVKHVFGPLEDWFNQFAPSLEKKYPPTWKTKKHVLRQVRGLLLSEELAKEYGQYFDGLSYDELDAVARSWHFDSCVQRKKLVAIMSEDALSTKQQ